MTNPTICLNMIVKNENKIITRLFDSVINIIDTFCICDTGSTDDTVKTIENYFKEKNMKSEFMKRAIELSITFTIEQVLTSKDDLIIIIKEEPNDTLQKLQKYILKFLNKDYLCFL